MSVSRRNFIKTAGIVAGATLVPSSVTAFGQEANAAFQNDGPADYTLSIADTPVEIAPKKIKAPGCGTRPQPSLSDRRSL